MRRIRKPDGVNVNRQYFIGEELYMGHDVLYIGFGFGVTDRKGYQGGRWLTHYSSGAIICAVRDMVDARHTAEFLRTGLPGTPIDWQKSRVQDINTYLTMKFISWQWDFNTWKRDKEIWLVGQGVPTGELLAT